MSFLPHLPFSRYSRKLKKQLNQFFTTVSSFLLAPTRSKLHTHSVALGVGILMFVAGTYFGIAHYLLPAIRALSESTHEMPYNANLADPETYSTAFNRGEVAGLSGYDDDSGAIIATANEVSLGRADHWWDIDYHYQRPFSIKNISNEPTPDPEEEEPTEPATLAAGTTVKITVNTAQLVAEGKLQANCNDLRVAYNSEPKVHHELPRSLQLENGATDCADSSTTILAFPVYTEIEKDNTSEGYALYYGHETAESPGSTAQGYNIIREDESVVNATLVCPFNGSTSCLGAEGKVEPTTATGAIRYGQGSALSFDGRNDYVDLGNNSLLDNAQDFTLEAWVNLSQIALTSGETDYMPILAKGNHNNASYDILLSRSGATWNANLYASGQRLVIAFPTSNYGQWYHVAFSRSGSTIYGFIEGVLVGQTEYETALIPNSHNLFIGHENSNGNPGARRFAGLIDEVRISTSARYTANFTPQTTPFEPDEQTALLLHFDEAGSDPRYPNQAIDASGNGNHGTIVGAKHVSGLVGVDKSSAVAGYLPTQTYGSHQGVFIEEGTTNLITNPSFEHGTYDTGWGLPYLNFDNSLQTFTPGVAKRNSAGPFAQGVMVQGNFLSKNPLDDDRIAVSKNLVAGNFNDVLDKDQGSIVFWITPEWNGNDNKSHAIIHSGDYLWLSKLSDNTLGFKPYWRQGYDVDVSDWVAGNTYFVAVRWDKVNTLDGVNHISISIQNVHNFGRTSSISLDVGGGLQIGYNPYSQGWSLDAIIEGLTIYRRPLFDGTYGIDVGNGNEIEQIYNSGAGQDPTLITGSWDVVFALPTNAESGTLTTGTGNAWTHPHASNLLYTNTTNTGGFMMNGTYTDDGWEPENHDIPGWIKVPGNETFNTEDFLVMKYNAKAWDTQADPPAVVADGGAGSAGGWAGDNSQTQYQAISTHQGRPWVNIAQNHGTYYDSKEACADAYSLAGLPENSTHLINNNEWMTIARNVTDVASNWTGGSVGSGQLPRGHSDNSPANSLEASSNDAEAWHGMTGANFGRDYNKRTLTLSNGEVVWDLAGNVYDWTDDIQSVAIHTTTGWVEWNHANVAEGAIDLYGPPDGYLSVQGMGQIYGGVLNNAFLRGGYWNNSAHAGVFALSLDYAPSFQYYGIGFRCASDKIVSINALSTEEKIFAGGYKITSNSANQGIKYTLTNLTPGKSYVFRAIANNGDGEEIGQPKVFIYDETNGHDLTEFAGTTTSTRTSPDNMIFTFELPTVNRYGGQLGYDWVTANTTAITVKLVNASNDGEVHFHQVELYENLIDNPSAEVGSGDPWKPIGWGVGEFGVTESRQELVNNHSGFSATRIIYSGAYAFKRYASSNVTRPVGSWTTLGVWGYKTTANISLTASYQGWRHQKQGATGNSMPGISGTVANEWLHLKYVLRKASSTTGYLHLGTNGTNHDVIYDDIYGIALSDVSLTVTPASQENSTEDSGLRVAGASVLTQSITDKLTTKQGSFKFKFTPRHSFANANKFGVTSPVIVHLYHDADNYLKLYRHDDSTLRLTGVFNSQVVNADWSNPTLDVNTTYTIQINYLDGGSLELLVDGVQQASASEVTAFASAPSILYFGTDNGGANSNPYDATFTNFEALEPSLNTTEVYTKFGDNSVKLVADTQVDEYTTSINPNSTATHTLSAYVYDGTTGNIGGEVTNNIAQLYFHQEPVATTYTDTGGGWWRLTGSLTAEAEDRRFGVQVKPGKTIYLDGVQLEQKDYATTYADGSLGEGYSWQGAANESSALRGATNITQSETVNVNQHSVAFWVKPNLDWRIGDTQDINYGLLDTNPLKVNCFRVYVRAYVSNDKFTIFTEVIPSTGSRSSINKTIYENWKDQWHHIAYIYDDVNNIMKIFIDGELVDERDITSYNSVTTTDLLRVGTTNAKQSNSTFSDLRIFDSALTEDEVADLYYQGLTTHTSFAEADDRYQETGTYTSPEIDLQANGAWGNTPLTLTDSVDPTIGSINYFTRTRASAESWSDWQPVSLLSGNNYLVASNPRRYLQWKAELTSTESNQTQSPAITGMVVSYIEDTTEPNNPTVSALGFANNEQTEPNLTSGNWYNYANPKFSWLPGEDPEPSDQASSGIHGYHVLLTKTQDAIPINHTGDNCYSYITDPLEQGGSITIGSNPSHCQLSDGVYYLYLQTLDNAGNISETPAHLFTYKYDATIPGVPASVASTTVGYSADNSFDFYWPPAVDEGGSGVSHYEYKTGATDPEDPFSQWQATSGPDDRMAVGVTAYGEGQNMFFVRTVDNAGNYSAIASNVAVAPFYYNQSAPTAPTNLVITPETSSDNPASSNVFKVSWDKPESYSGEISKYYYCVNCTPSASTMTETTSAETVERALVDVALATQQDKNTFYIVAEDNNINTVTGYGNRNFDAYASVEFYASTTAPTAPENLTISDTSNRDSKIWRLTLVWNEPDDDSGVVGYDVYRSADEGDTYTKIGNVSSGAYTDTNLTFEQSYSYKVRAVDNANSPSLFSNVVSESPMGRYTDPPAPGGVPVVSVGSTTATISWQTSRESFGTVEYGRTSEYGSAASSTTATSSHSIKVTGLGPGITYHYRVHSLDDSSLVGYDRAKAYSADYSFTTLNSADISNVEITDVGLNFAVIQWNTASLASSQVSYGLTTEYEDSVNVSVTPDESTHTVRLSNLEHSTQYHFRIQGITADDSDIASEDYTFSTLTFPKVTALLLNTDQEATGATLVLAWATNVPTTGAVQYQPVDLDLSALSRTRMGDKLLVDTPSGQTLNINALQELSQEELAVLPAIPSGEVQTIYQGDLNKRHIQRISGLSDGAMYVLTVRGVDEHGNEVISDPVRYVTGVDTRPPEINNLIIETPISGTGSEAKASIIISWETDEPAYGQIHWGLGSGASFSNSTEKTAEGTMKHVMVLRDLAPTQSYHLKVEATDLAGNITTTDDMVVVTPTAQQAAFDIVLKNLEEIFGFLRW